MMFPAVALLGACKETARRGVWGDERVWVTNSSLAPCRCHMITMMINNDAIAIPLH